MTEDHLQTARPRILFVSPVMPAPGGNGLAMRCGVFLDAAKRLGDVDVLVTSLVEGAAAGDVAFAQEGAHRLIVLESKDRRDTLLSLIAEASDPQEQLTAFQAYGRPMVCLCHSVPVLKDAAWAVKGIHYDLCVVMRVYSLPVLQAVAQTAQIDRIFCDLDDDDVQLAQDQAEDARRDEDALKAQWHDAEAQIFEKFRKSMGELATLFSVASPGSFETLRRSKDLRAMSFVPNGIAMAEPEEPSDAPHMLFLGTLTYGPNEAGVLWLLREVLPLIRMSVPEAQMTIIGRNPSAETSSAVRSARGVTLLNDVDDVSDAYRTCALAVVPLLSGSGTRIKILEAGAYGVAVVSTQKGAEGLDLRDGFHGWITPPDPKAFAAACIDALSNPAKRAQRAAQLRNRVARHHERSKVVTKIHGLLAQEIAAMSNPSPS